MARRPARARSARASAGSQDKSESIADYKRRISNARNAHRHSWTLAGRRSSSSVGGWSDEKGAMPVVELKPKSNARQAQRELQRDHLPRFNTSAKSIRPRSASRRRPARRFLRTLQAQS
jgi:hypothetical protein